MENEKLISFAVPCFNSQNYMRHCVDSLLAGGEAVEVIIINDGSSDDTLKIANAYAEQFPDTVKVIDKENGGHGSGVNAGLKVAVGLYYKVVDSDDWLDADALKTLLEKIKQHLKEGNLPDMYVTNFVYDQTLRGLKHVSAYRNKMPADKIIGWEKIKKFRYSHMMLMHALLYRRKKLLESDTVLPEHTFYVDNIYAYKPLPFMKTLCYLDLDLYHYFIGRDDQSVNRKNFVKRYMQQIRVMLCLTDAYKWKDIKKFPKGLKKYMWHSLEAIMMTTLLFVSYEYAPERKAALREMWRHIKENDRPMYRKLRSNSYATAVVYLPWRLRGKVMTAGYNFLCRKVKLGE